MVWTEIGKWTTTRKPNGGKPQHLYQKVETFPIVNPDRLRNSVLDKTRDILQVVLRTRDG